MKNLILILFTLLACTGAPAVPAHPTSTQMAANQPVVSTQPSVATASATEPAPVVYLVSPHHLVEKYEDAKALPAIRARLPEIRDLGANVLWIQPVTPSAEQGQGYDVVDYERVSPDYGTEEDLKSIVRDAHQMGLKVMLDVVLNHSSKQHPFVKDLAKNGKGSRYVGWYQTQPIKGIPYARHFHVKQVGQWRFVFYFWDQLFNFDWSSEAVRQYMIGNLENWIKKFDVDGYRFDVSWAVSSRWPGFYSTVSKRLRALKPKILLLAEDHAGYPKEYAGTGHPHLKGSGFDWAYDWDNQDSAWISKWAFQYGDEKETVFNAPEPSWAAKEFIRRVGFTKQVDVEVLRFLENNDTSGFRRNHTLEETKFAALAIYLLPGVPLIFYGQEVGNDYAQWELPSFDPKRKIAEKDPKLYAFYKSLLAMRASSRALSEGSLENLKLIPPSRVSFERRLGSEIRRVELDFKKREVILDGRRL